jgi:hypothetical protein
MTKSNLMKALAKHFEGLDIRDASDFHGRKSVGLWLPNASYDFGVRGMEEKGDNKLNDFIESKGWFIEPYDAETMMCYPQ